MKRNSLTLTVGALLLIIFIALLFTFQVRETEVALVTRFGKPTRDELEPGLKFKLPWPIEKVQKYDKRTQTLESKFGETYTQDKITVLVTVFAGWNIENPTLFRQRFDDSVDRARNQLADMIRNEKDAVIASHPFSELVSADESQLKFAEIENEMLQRVKPMALENYGINVGFLGIKRLGLPETITQKVFERMREERTRVVRRLEAEGQAEAARIRSDANRERAELLSKAEARVIELKGEAEREAAKSLQILNQKPELALFLLDLRALEELLKQNSTLILNQRAPGANLLNGMQNR
jgi:membrane protease subunit HflC